MTWNSDLLSKGSIFITTSSKTTSTMATTMAPSTPQ